MSKECIRCGMTEKEIRKDGIKICYVGWGSYKRHDYSKPVDMPNNLIKSEEEIVFEDPNSIIQSYNP